MLGAKMKQFSPFRPAAARSWAHRAGPTGSGHTRCADHSHVQFQSKKVLEREGRRQQIRLVAVCIRPLLTTGIPLLPPQRHPDLPIQCFPSKVLPPEAEPVPFQVHSSALPLCFKPQELNYTSKVKTSSANSSGDVP